MTHDTERAASDGACDGGQPAPLAQVVTSSNQPAVAEHAVSPDTHTGRHVPVAGGSGPTDGSSPNLAPGGVKPARRAFSPLPWPAERLEALKKHWRNPALSVSGVANEMGLTKGQVSGMARRLELGDKPGYGTHRPVSGRPRKTAPITAPPRPSILGQNAKAVETRQAKARAAIPSIATPRPADTLPVVTHAAGAVCTDVAPPRLFAPLAPAAHGRRCIWPMWGNGRPTAVFCDAPRDGGRLPYCAEHHRRAVRPKGEAA